MINNMSCSFFDTNTAPGSWTIFENKDFCNIVMASKDTKILEFNQY